MLTTRALLWIYGPAFLAFGVAVAVAWLGRAKARQSWLRPGLALACLLGWAALEPLGRLRTAALVPSLAPSLLLVPAAAIVLIEIVRSWRGGRNDRWLSVFAAASAGWWLARNTAGPAEFWRVAIVVAGLTGLIAAIVRQQPGRALAVALTLWGGLAVLGSSTGWGVAAAVLVAGCGAALAVRAPPAMSSALVASLVAGIDLSRGRLARGHLDAADWLCVLAVAAPMLAGLVEPRVGKRWRALAPVLAAAVAVALVWGIHRLRIG